MAERFPDFEIQEIQQLKENSENQDIRKSTSWLDVWTCWAEKELWNQYKGYRMVFASIWEHASSVLILASTSIWQIFLASSEHFRKQKACGADEIW